MSAKERKRLGVLQQVDAGKIANRDGRVRLGYKDSWLDFVEVDSRGGTVEVA